MQSGAVSSEPGPQGPAPSESVAVQDPPAPPAGRSIGARTIRGSVWTIAGYSASQALRFISSFWLVHLVDKAELGRVALAQVVINGLIMFSDFGVGPSIIQNPRGDDPRFVNTAWTIQAIRGVWLSIGAALLAWPAARFFNEPMAGLLMVAGLTAMVTGFNSTKVFSLQRHLALGRVTALEFSCHVLTIVAIIAGCSIAPSAWTVVLVSLATTTIRMALTHVVLPGTRNRFDWEPEARHAIARFGRWIFLSSAVTFIAGKSDIVLLGKFLGAAGLQVYSFSARMPDTMLDLVVGVTHSSVFAGLSRVAGRDQGAVRRAYLKARLALDAISLPALGGLTTCSAYLTEVLLPASYADASWIIRALCIRSAMACTLMPGETALFSLGHSKYAPARNAARAVWVIAGIPIGWSVAGLPGVVGVMALSEIPVLLVLWPAAIKHNIFSPLAEARALAFFGIGAGLGVPAVWVARMIYP